VPPRDENIERQWEALAERYRGYLALERGLSANSVSSYMADIAAFAGWLHATHGILPPQAGGRHIEEFLASLYDSGKKKTSQARMLSGLKSFYNYLIYTGASESAPTEFIDPPKLSRRLPDTLTVEQIDAVLSAIDLSSPQGHRNRAMLELLYSCGLRVSELTGLRLQDIFMDQGVVRVTGKGDKQRLVPVGDEAQKRVGQYLESRLVARPTAAGREILFLNRSGGPLSRIMVFNIIKDSVRAAGLERSVSPHTFRHSFATHLLQGGANIRQIQQMLGHESILTTEIYTHVERSGLRESLEEHHPFSC
jgi:integrase/recombinase XerD